MIEKITSPKDIKKLNISELDMLSHEIREEITKTTLENGGHLASNLGAVEITLALHYVFDCPEDKFVFDVGHQCYTHKLLTGRENAFSSLRTKGGITGFTNHLESEYDTFDSGHASTAISSALGLARARDAKNDDYNVVAIVGDGAIGGGMALEALNDAGGSSNTKLIIVLNDNEMSISKNVGALSSHFAKLRTARKYISGKRKIRNALEKISIKGHLVGAITHLRNTVRYFLLGETIFEAMNIKYLGPINGHSLSDLIEIFNRAKYIPGPVIIHTITRKGKGYSPAEENPEIYHGVSKNKTNTDNGFTKYSSQLGKTLIDFATEDSRICAITAGMTYNTGLKEFAKKFPDRFYDTGIAEEHAIALAGGLAKGGMKPFVVIYSTFLQRGFDQIFHDICLQNVPVVICDDHSGLVGEDGATHQGVFDMGFLRSMPNLTVLAPKDTVEFEKMLKYSAEINRPVVIKYPSGGTEPVDFGQNDDFAKWDKLVDGENGCIITFGRMIKEGLKIAEETNYSLVNARCLKPFDEEMLMAIKDKKICIIEDNAPEGGLLEGILRFYNEHRISSDIVGFYLKDEFVNVGTVQQQQIDNGIDSETVIKRLKNEIR